METILLATSNPHKVEEFKTILDTLGVKVNIITPKYFNDESEPVEDGDTYSQNSFIKANYYYQKYHYPTLADDSGIEIDFYDGKPGIHSARFHADLDYFDRNNLILKEMKDSDNRGAYFKCYVTYIKDGNTSVYEGIVKGRIAYKQEGNEGFGYDPIFISEGQDKTNAVLGQDFKNRNSHRAIALGKWAKDFESK